MRDAVSILHSRMIKLAAKIKNGYFNRTLLLLSGKNMRIRLYVICIAILLSAGGGWYIFNSGIYRTGIDRIRLLLESDGDAATPKTSRLALENNIRARLGELEIPPSLVTNRYVGPDSVPEIRVFIPQGKPIEWIVWRLSTATAGTSYDIEDCICTPNGSKCTIRFVSRSSNNSAIILSLRRSARFFSSSGKMAIIITDFGCSTDRLTVEYLSFPQPLTMAIFPLQRLSEQTASISSKYKKEVIVLLSMEPVTRTPLMPRESLIMLHYPETRIKTIVDNAAMAVPSLSGFSNNGGSRVLADSRVMDVLFSEFRKRHAYFIEFPVTKKSLVATVALRHAVPTAVIDHIIDTAQTSATIRDALIRFGNEARRRGSCIVCSALNEKFLRGLKNAQPELSKEGVALTFISDLFPDRMEEKKQ
jgi:polysaccharide deacetylase 2 family uncharacterized protein YibQ